MHPGWSYAGAAVAIACVCVALSHAVPYFEKKQIPVVSPPLEPVRQSAHQAESDVMDESAYDSLTFFRTSSSRTVNGHMYNRAFMAWRRMNPHNQVVWYDDLDCDAFMDRQPSELQLAYHSLRPGAFKADLFRLCVLYEHGGCYVDGCSVPHVPLKTMLSLAGVSPALARQGPFFVSALEPVAPWAPSQGIHNGFLIVSRRHPFVKAGIQHILRVVCKRGYSDSPLSVTGPVNLARAIQQLSDPESRLPFSTGHNVRTGHDMYLFSFERLVQNIRAVRPGNRGEVPQLLVSKKYDIWKFLFVDLLAPSRYTNMWHAKQVYRPVVPMCTHSTEPTEANEELEVPLVAHSAIF